MKASIPLATLVALVFGCGSDPSLVGAAPPDYAPCAIVCSYGETVTLRAERYELVPIPGEVPEALTCSECAEKLARFAAAPDTCSNRPFSVEPFECSEVSRDAAGQ